MKFDYNLFKFFGVSPFYFYAIFFQVDKYEEALKQFKVNCDKLQQQYRECHCALMQAEQQVIKEEEKFLNY